MKEKNRMASRVGRFIFALFAFVATALVVTEASANVVGFCKFDNAGQLQNLQLNGNALAVNSVVNLTPYNQHNETGSAYYKTPIALTNGTVITTHFQYRMFPNATNPDGGAGFAFVFQNKGITALGGNGDNLGLSGVSPSLAIKFDTSQGPGEPSNNFVAVVQDGNTVLTTATPSFNLKNGATTDVWIDYGGGVLNVYLAQGGPKPATPLITLTVNLYQAVNAVAHGNTVIVGFSGGTSNTTKNNHDIVYWVLSNDGTPLSECIPCQNDTQCAVVPQTPACQPNGFCGECSATNSTRCIAPFPVCDTSSGTCVECNTNAQCSGNTPVCQNHVCVPCTSDAQCSNPTPACQTTGPLAGSCTQCSTTNGTLCVAPTPVCLPGTGTCGCTTDAQCGGAGSGQICSGNICVPGCRPNGNGGTCATGQVCSPTAGGNNTGTCVVGCLIDGDCVQPIPNCLVVGGNGVCVQCVDNQDCVGNPAGPLCTPQHTCGQCTPTNTTNCSPTGAGSACTVTGQCGCVTDADCGGPNSGRICDDNAKVCRSGCRPEGATGNHCPIGDICVNGTCVTNPGDGGVDGGGLDGGTDGGGDAGDAGDGGKTDGGGTDGGKTDGGGTDSGISFPDGGGDAGPLDDISLEGGGCDCSTLGTSSTSQFGALGLSALAMLVMVRRRRRR
jgi:MYXO-CTERM domain-containing protein